MIFKSKLLLLTAIAYLLSAPAVADTDPEVFRTYEFRAGYQTWRVKSAMAYSRGYTGAGTRIAILDSGINAANPDLAPKFATTGYDAFTGTFNATTDSNGHGTFVAGVAAAAKNNYGMQGIAFDATLVPIRVVDAAGNVTASDRAIADSVYFATNWRAAAQNNSWNSTTTIYQVNRPQIDAALPWTLGAWRHAVASNQIIVFAAGNNASANPGFYASLPTLYPELTAGWIAVVGTDANAVIASWSDRCGSAAAWCLAAPGEGLLSTYRNGFASGSGTSFAAPVVSAAVALLKQRWPYLSNAQIRDILFRTANKSGIYADAATYGQGFLDLDRATQPLGTVTVPTGRSVSGATQPAAGTAATFGRSIASVAGSQLPEMIVLDELGRDFTIDAAALFNHAPTSFDAAPALASLGESMQNFQQGETTLRYSMQPDSRASLPDAPLDGLRLLLDAPIGRRTRLTTSTNVSPALTFGLTPTDAVLDGLAIDSEAITNPFVAFAKSPTSIAVRQALSPETWIKAGTFVGEQATDPTAPHTVAADPNLISKRGSVFGAIGELGFNLAKHSAAALTAGLTEETNAFLGSISAGAATLSRKTTTGFIAASARAELARGLTGFAGFEFGLSSAAVDDNSIVKSITGVASQAYRIGIIKRGLVHSTDHFGLVLSGPLTVTSGSAALELPTARDTEGRITTTRANLTLAPSAQEIDVQAFYATPIADRGSFNGGVLFRENAGHVEGAREAVLLARYKVAF